MRIGCSFLGIPNPFFTACKELQQSLSNPLRAKPQNLSERMQLKNSKLMNIFTLCHCSSFALFTFNLLMLLLYLSLASSYPIAHLTSMNTFFAQTSYEKILEWIGYKSSLLQTFHDGLPYLRLPHLIYLPFSLLVKYSSCYKSHPFIFQMNKVKLREIKGLDQSNSYCWL